MKQEEWRISSLYIFTYPELEDLIEDRILIVVLYSCLDFLQRVLYDLIWILQFSFEIQIC